jgi:undecaprenyl-diphosphatase
MPVSDSVIFITTVLASTETFTLVLVLVSLYVARKRNLIEGLFIAGSTAVLLASVWGLKLWFAVPRPPDALMSAGGYAFPSGHAAGVLFMVLVLEWYSRSMFRGQQLYFLRVALGVLVLAVGYSRVYLQVHTPLQVLAGFLIGGVIGILFQYFVRRLSVK